MFNHLSADMLLYLQATPLIAMGYQTKPKKACLPKCGSGLFESSTKKAKSLPTAKCPFLKVDIPLFLLFQATLLFIIAVPKCGVSYAVICFGFPLVVITLVLICHLKLAVNYALSKFSERLERWNISVKLYLFKQVKSIRRHLLKYSVFQLGIRSTRSISFIEDPQRSSIELQPTTSDIDCTPQEAIAAGDELFPAGIGETQSPGVIDSDDDTCDEDSRPVSLFREGKSSSTSHGEQADSVFPESVDSGHLPKSNPAITALENKVPQYDPPLPPPEPFDKTMSFSPPCGFEGRFHDSVELVEDYPLPVPELSGPIEIPPPRQKQPVVWNHLAGHFVYLDEKQVPIVYSKFNVEISFNRSKMLYSIRE